MESKAYEYMDWPRIEAIVYGEEASPKDVMAPRLTTDGVLVQGFFPEADKAEVLVGSRKYEMEKEDEAGYFAAMIPGRKIPEYEYRVTRGEEVQEFSDPYAFAGQITEAEEKAFCAGVYYHAYEKLGAHPMEINGVREQALPYGHRMQCASVWSAISMNGTEDAMRCTECQCRVFLNFLSQV